ncbi:SNAPc_SNAP43 domain-containing protein, partial [Cephalotus follicularis]
LNTEFIVVKSKNQLKVFLLGRKQRLVLWPHILKNLNLKSKLPSPSSGEPKLSSASSSPCVMDLSPFKLDIDELINEFVECESTTLADMKRVWLSRKFSYIYEASPSTNLAFFMQSLYAHTIGHMFNPALLSRRLGGLYCLYCLYQTQPFKPPFRIYLSLGELKKLESLVVEAKGKGINVVIALVKRMLEMDIFLFGSMDINDGSFSETVNQLTEIQNARTRVAYEKLFANTRIEHFLHMDLGMEVDLNVLKKMSTDYAEAKKQAIEEASELVDVQNIKHISNDSDSIGDVVDKIDENWNVQKQVFYEQTGLNQRPVLENQQQQQDEDEEQDDEEYNNELERLLSQP